MVAAYGAHACCVRLDPPAGRSIDRSIDPWSKPTVPQPGGPRVVGRSAPKKAIHQNKSDELAGWQLKQPLDDGPPQLHQPR